MLRDIDLGIKPGMRLGIVGPSGAGRSAFPALWPRLDDIPEGVDPDGRPWGTICFDGRDVRDLPLDAFRRPAALVPQQALLFEDPIRTNLLYADPEAAEDRIREALRIADLGGTVASFPDGLAPPSASVAIRSPAASGRGSPWPARSSRSPPSRSRTIAPAPWTPRPGPASSRPSSGISPAAPS